MITITEDKLEKLQSELEGMGLEEILETDGLDLGTGYRLDDITKSTDREFILGMARMYDNFSLAISNLNDERYDDKSVQTQLLKEITDDYLKELQFNVLFGIFEQIIIALDCQE